MITLQNRFFPLRSAVCFVVEGGIILFSVVASFSLIRNGADSGISGIREALVQGMVIAFFCQSCMYLLDMYDLKNSQSLGEIFFSLLFAIGIVCIGIGIVSTAIPEFAVAGLMYYYTVVFVALFLLFWRIAFDAYLTKIAPRENILIMGTAQTARLVAREVVARGRLGFRLVGFSGEPGPDDGGIEGIGPVLGANRDVVELAMRHEVRKIVVAINERRGGYPVESLLALRVRGCQVVEWAEFFEKLSGRIAIDNLAPSYFIFQEGFRKSRLLLSARRLVSSLIALLMLILLAPLLSVVALLIRVDSSGPVFYTQRRVGKNGKEFEIVKFRTMRQDAETGTGARWASRDDPRITRFGKFLRLSRIDEIPQLVNVLRGDIDLVGPRPERPEFVEKLRELIPYYDLRHTVKPGLTGWAQVMFNYCGTIEESKEKLQYDLFYIKNMSLKLDLLILFQTIKIVLLGRGAR